MYRHSCYKAQKLSIVLVSFGGPRLILKCCILCALKRRTATVDSKSTMQCRKVQWQRLQQGKYTPRFFHSLGHGFQLCWASLSGSFLLARGIHHASQFFALLQGLRPIWCHWNSLMELWAPVRSGIRARFGRLASKPKVLDGATDKCCCFTFIRLVTMCMLKHRRSSQEL